MNNLWSIGVSVLLFFSNYKATDISISNVGAVVRETIKYISTQSMLCNINDYQTRQYISMNKAVESNLNEVCKIIYGYFNHNVSLDVSYDEDLDCVQVYIVKQEYENIYSDIKKIEKDTVHLRYMENSWITIDTNFQKIQ